MSFQSFQRREPKIRSRAKNLPSYALMGLLNALCTSSPNDYDSRLHVLTVESPEYFSNALALRGRSLHSFERQLRMAGFRRRRVLVGDEGQERVVCQYVWKGKRETYIAKDLQFATQHWADLHSRILKAKEDLKQRRQVLDSMLEKLLFSGLAGAEQSSSWSERSIKVLKEAKITLNSGHLTSREILEGVSTGVANELSIYRLLVFREGQQEE